MYHSAPNLTLYGHMKSAQHGPLYSNTVIRTLAVDGWAATFGTVRRVLRETERESRFLTAHQHKTGHSVPFEVKIKANGIIR